MGQKEVEEYIHKLLAQGYPPNAIRAQLIAYGYPPAQIDVALREVTVTRVHHVLEFSPKVLFVILLVLGLLGGGIFAILQIATPTQALLDMSVQPTTTELTPGGTLVFVKEIINLGGKRRFDVQLTHQIRSLETNEILTTRKETVAVETRASSPTQIPLPKTILPGDYTLTTLAEYDSKRAEASFRFKVLGERAIVSTCRDKQKNQGEEGVDCGGPCPECPEPEELQLGECPGGCNDFDSCTGDSCLRGRCVHDLIAPCCGNFVCEAGETSLGCPDDCAITAVTKKPDELLADATAQAAQNPERAAKICSTILLQDYADRCYGQVAQAAKTALFCTQIQDTEIRDGCYLGYAQATDDYSICAQLQNRLYRTSCNSFRNLKSI